MIAGQQCFIIFTLSYVPSGGTELLQTLPVTQIYYATHREGCTRGNPSPMMEREWNHHSIEWNKNGGRGFILSMIKAAKYTVL